MLTRNGISYDLENSPYKVVKNYNDTEIIFKFSSQYYVNKFNEKLENNRKTINESITKRFKINFTNDFLCDLKLYNDVEKRGFFIFIDGGGCRCLNNIKLDGQNKILTN